MSSVIQVPAQSSVYVTSLLFTLCQEISRVGGHALDRYTALAFVVHAVIDVDFKCSYHTHFSHCLSTEYCIAGNYSRAIFFGFLF